MTTLSSISSTLHRRRRRRRRPRFRRRCRRRCKVNFLFFPRLGKVLEDVHGKIPESLKHVRFQNLQFLKQKRYFYVFE